MQSLDPLGKLATRAQSDASGESGERSRAGGPATRARCGVSDAPAENKRPPARRNIRLPKPGDILSRVYKGRQITVRVLESGFEYEGRRFRSLSAIAKAVTGAHWNGLLFFGIVRQER